ncbi:MAG: hypothetical protein V3W34_05415 [Phycisphaerae bacterium]
MSQILCVFAARNLDHVGNLADEIDLEARIGGRDFHVIDEASKDGQGFIPE